LGFEVNIDSRDPLPTLFNTTFTLPLRPTSPFRIRLIPYLTPPKARKFKLSYLNVIHRDTYAVAHGDWLWRMRHSNSREIRPRPA
jgi:hypothetical protein